VWCYEPAAPGDFDAKNEGGASKWYPGSDVVDWFSIDLYAAHDVRLESWSKFVSEVYWNAELQK